MIKKILVVFFLCFSISAQSANIRSYTEETPKSLDTPVQKSKHYNDYKNKLAAEENFIVGSAKKTFTRFHNRYRIPGFISASPVTEIATIIGPRVLDTSFRLGDSVFLRWNTSPGPREGDIYQVFPSSVVLQSRIDPTEFQVISKPETLDEIAENFRLAGYFYEPVGSIKISKIRRGLVEGVVLSLSGQMSIGQSLMPKLPEVIIEQPHTGGVHIAAAIVSGSPANRLSTTKRSYIYINRGTRDGIKVGSLFEAVERMDLSTREKSMGPETSFGEAMVVHVSDNFSTAVITKQFDIIRVGSLLRSKQLYDQVTPISPFASLNVLNPNYLYEGHNKSVIEGELSPEVPKSDELSGMPDPTLPNPERLQTSPFRVAPDLSKPPISQLDALEKSLNLNNLSEEEKKKLNQLSTQQKIDSPDDELEDLSASGSSPTVTNSFRTSKPKKKDDKKKKPKRNEEEELNLLMMEN
ncbi:MAG: hypothetical protein M9962_07510 [Oligoflexia bacterium]|nr:hypothetical protein [Oligoflexia bacterium]